MNHVDQGGAALALYDLISEIKKKYKWIIPIVITGKSNTLNKAFSEMGVENYSSVYKNFLSTSRKPVFFWRFILKCRYYLCLLPALWDISRKVDLNSIDIIHTNLDRIDIGAILSKKKGIPHIWHVREYSDFFDLTCIKKDEIKYMNSFDSFFIFISDAVYRHWERRGLVVGRGKLIYDGIRTDSTHIINEINTDIVRCIFLGGYSDGKGQTELLEAIYLLPDDMKNKIHIDFFGEDFDGNKSRLISKAKQLSITDYISIFDYDKNIVNILDKYDIGFNCSKSEGFGRVTVEYMFNGLCPIVSDGGANTEIVKKGYGIVYKKGHAEDLSKKIEWVIQNKKEVNTIRSMVREYCINNYSIEKHAQDVINLYKNVLGIR